MMSATACGTTRIDFFRATITNSTARMSTTVRKTPRGLSTFSPEEGYVQDWVALRKRGPVRVVWGFLVHRGYDGGGSVYPDALHGSANRKDGARVGRSRRPSLPVEFHPASALGDVGDDGRGAAHVRSGARRRFRGVCFQTAFGQRADDEQQEAGNGERDEHLRPQRRAQGADDRAGERSPAKHEEHQVDREHLDDAQSEREAHPP